MDATMVAMRSASEQQLTRDCLSGVDVCDGHDVGISPSVESLMTLLWAVKVIDKERQHKTPNVDAAMEVGQECGELDILFGQRGMKERRVSFSPGESGKMGQKSLEGWRTAYQHD